MTRIVLLLLCLPLWSTAQQDPIFTDYRSEAFNFNGQEAKVVFPNSPNENRYWVWRARFWGHEPQLDQALLDRGFHLVYVDVADMFGNDKAIDLWNQFYEHCTQTYQLHQKVVLEGMSRGGLIVYNWASQNTDKVFSIYADAPVCDIKSWPGGLYSGKGSPKAWEKCLEAYSLDSLSVLNFKGIPLNTCIPVAQAGIPVMHVYGAADTVVPAAENTELLAKTFKAAGGSILLYPKPGVGHHPHSLKDPTPILQFIQKSIEDTQH